MTEKVAKEKKVEKTVEKVAPKPIVAKPKMVKVTPKFSGKRFISGDWYEFTRDKEIEVTEDVKRSLLGAGAIYL